MIERRNVSKRSDVSGVIIWATILMLSCVLGALLSAAFAKSAHAQIPEACYKYQRYLTAVAEETFGINDARIPVLAAQIQQESGCRDNARSGVGAQGLTQFMPATAKWLAELYPTQLGAADPLNWKWAIDAQVLYMRYLTSRHRGATDCDTYAFALSSYNGGEGWLVRDQQVCYLANDPHVCGPPVCDKWRWFDNVELFPDKRRAPANIRENRGYPDRIMRVLAPRYASWGTPIKCKGAP